MTQPAPHPGEPHDAGTSGRLNQLRAGVLGANDGIVSTAGIVVGMAAATTSGPVILSAGLAGVAAGALSMAAGEYVSVSTQRDTEKAMLATERIELREDPEAELDELAGLYEAKGLTPDLAHEVAVALTEKDALRAHAEVELHIDPDELTSPWQAAVASIVAFTIGGALPLLAVLLVPTTARIPVTFVAVVLALALTGSVSARLGQAPPGRATVRTVIGGALAMGVTYALGSAFDVSGM
ncbi:VIT1/CCC1 family predicted Fe2+/Mn2+ transporter [Mumia flava]|uniref:VIT1/CCC1 family predicted Fe2+/Mn2+ transporter n=1 Tax=Mumia flava TaxID=1348852 RepID=A0A0B2B950_9ACTN|nr:VIT family protein [Mumia flava]PJJ53470.1 VIT1/CCC1 family predicted Fe2+/Mn2+ transporter [Mumia flava]